MDRWLFSKGVRDFMKNGGDPQPWDDIYQREGRVFAEPFLGFEALVEDFKAHACEEILDLGCGSGRHVVHLLRRGFRVTGMDNSPTALRMTREWLVDDGMSAELVLADMRAPLPFATETFSGLLSTQVIHHARLVTIRGTIAEIGRVLKRGGVAFVTVPAPGKQSDDMIEIEHGTYVPQTGWEKGLLHHFFRPEDYRREFKAFEVLHLSLRGENEVIAILVRKESR